MSTKLISEHRGELTGLSRTWKLELRIAGHDREVAVLEQEQSEDARRLAISHGSTIHWAFWVPSRAVVEFEQRAPSWVQQAVRSVVGSGVRFVF